MHSKGSQVELPYLSMLLISPCYAVNEFEKVGNDYRYLPVPMKIVILHL